MRGLQGPGLYVSGVIESGATTTLEPKYGPLACRMPANVWSQCVECRLMYGPSVPQQNAGTVVLIAH